MIDKSLKYRNVEYTNCILNNKYEMKGGALKTNKLRILSYNINIFRKDSINILYDILNYINIIPDILYFQKVLINDSNIIILNKLKEVYKISYFYKLKNSKFNIILINNIKIIEKFKEHKFYISIIIEYNKIIIKLLLLHSNNNVKYYFKNNTLIIGNKYIQYIKLF